MNFIRRSLGDILGESQESRATESGSIANTSTEIQNDYNDPHLTKKAKYMRTIRADPVKKEEMQDKNRQHQSASRKRLKALSGLGQAVLDRELLSEVISAVPADEQQEILNNLTVADIEFEMKKGSGVQVNPQVCSCKVYNIMDVEYMDVTTCEHCRATCPEPGVCNPRTCICFNTNMVCEHSYCCPATPFYRPTQSLEIKSQGSMGDGAFAKRDYPAEFFLGDYTGSVISKAGANNILNTTTGHIYLMALPRAIKGKNGSASNMYINGEKGNQTRMINHSCDPNVRFEVWDHYNEDDVPRIAVVTSKSVKEGEAFGADYGWSECSLRSRRSACSCNASNCKGYL